MKSAIQKGKLYLVATPIGNLGDITLRAIEILKSVDMIAAEDTRVTGKLLKYYVIPAKMESFHNYNEARKKDKIISYLLSGQSVAVVSDAGTPGISDPAFSLVRDAVNAGIETIAIPGATSVITALVVSGLPMDKFYFGGFPPVKPGPKRKFFENLINRPETLIIFESTHRLWKTLEAIQEVFGDRQCALCRDLTKKFEQVIRDSLSSILANRNDIIMKGEFVLVISGNRG